jgi:hypothetical protein
MEFLKSNGREDLCTRFTNDLHTVMLESKTAKEANLSTAVTVDDNLNEENMEVDDEQDEKQKKQLSISEYNDVDYRFLDQDMDHRMTTTVIPENEQRNNMRRRSRFSEVLSSHRDADDRAIKSNLMGEEKDETAMVISSDSDFRTDDAKIISPR